MNERDFLNAVLQCVGMFSSAVSTGAQWEIAAQVFISMKLMEGYGVMGREIKYPNSNKKAVDLAFQYNQVNYAVEIKVESANEAGKFAGVSLKSALAEDSEKLKTFNLPGAVKWVVCVAYSSKSKTKLRTLHTQGKFTSIDEEGSFLAGILRVN
jgi:hypothetical protein